MTTTLTKEILEKLFNVQGYFIVSCECVKNANIQTEEIYLELQSLEESKCPSCGLQGNKYRYDSTEQTIYLGSILCKSVYAKLKVYRTKCPDCGTLTERQTISKGKNRYSKSVPSMILQYTRLMDNQSVSKLLGLSK